MSGTVIRNFADAEERVTFDLGHLDLVTASSLALGREVLEPGWRWSVHVKPIVGTERCEFHHVTIVLEGRVGFESRDGELAEAGPCDVADIAPGHDSWVIGHGSAVLIDVQGVLGWAKAPEAGDRLLTTLLFTDIVGSTGDPVRPRDLCRFEWARRPGPRRRPHRRSGDGRRRAARRGGPSGGSNHERC